MLRKAFSMIKINIRTLKQHIHRFNALIHTTCFTLLNLKRIEKKTKSRVFHSTTHRSLQTRLSVLDFAELFNLALVYILLQLPSGVFIGQRAPLHQVVDNRLQGKVSSYFTKFSYRT